MSKRTCPKCGGKNIHDGYTTAICTDCGEVVPTELQNAMADLSNAIKQTSAFKFIERLVEKLSKILS